MAAITRAQMLPLLVEACPGYEADWKQFVTDYTDDPGPFFYVAITQFSRCLSSALAAGDRETVGRVFTLLELFITDGDAEVQEAAVIGIIKNLQNANLHEVTVPNDYLLYLLPETRRWWDKVRTFWTNGRLLIED